MTFDTAEAETVLMTAALASKAENDDSIDSAVIGTLENPGALDSYDLLSFTALRPGGQTHRSDGSRQRTATRFKAAKGAPQVIMDMAGLDSQRRRKVQAVIEDLAAKGQRTLGVGPHP